MDTQEMRYWHRSSKQQPTPTSGQKRLKKTSVCWCPINGATRVHLVAQAEIWYSTRPLALYCEGLQSVTDSPVRYDCKLAIRKVEIYQFVARRGLRTFLLVLRFCQKRRDEQKNYLETRYGQGIYSLRGYRRCPSGNREPCERCRVFGYGKEEK